MIELVSLLVFPTPGQERSVEIRLGIVLCLTVRSEIRLRERHSALYSQADDDEARLARKISSIA